MNPQLKLFTNPWHVSQVDRGHLALLLEHYKEYLPAAAGELLTGDLKHEPFCVWWAGQCSSPGGFGGPLLQALAQIEELAEPENRAVLEEALGHLPAGYEVNRNYPPLSQALHLWVIAENTPGVIWPRVSSNCPSPGQGESLTHSGVLVEENPGAEASSPQPSPPEEERERALGVPGVAAPDAGATRKEASDEPDARRVGASSPQPSPPEEERERALGVAAPDAGATQKEATPSDSGAASPTPHSESSAPGASRAETFVRLARLPLADYDQVRRAEAKRLGLRLRTLDHEVGRVRDIPDEAQAYAVKLPDLAPWPEPIADAPGLFDQVHDRALLYLHLPPGAAVVLALWPAHAQAIDAFARTPRLNFTSSEPGCGKSTALDFLATVCPRVLRTDNLKTAVLYRVVDKQKPTLLLDELDAYLHLFPELRGLLNASNSQGASVLRCEGHVVRSFKAFAATALAGMGHLAPTLRDRSIVIHLEKAPAGAIRARFDSRHTESETKLGCRIARWAKDNFDAITACEPVMPACNRLADNWRPLFAIAQIIGGHWPQRVLDAFNHLASRPRAAAGTTPADDLVRMLVSDLRSIFAAAGADRLFSSYLVGALRALPNRPWSGAHNGDKPLNEARLARYLSALGIRSQTLRIDGEHARGYLLSAFETGGGETAAAALDFEV